MQIQAIQNTNIAFEKKARVLRENQMDNLKELLTKMNAETKNEQTDVLFRTTITKKLSSPKTKVKLIDGRLIFNKTTPKRQMQGETILKLGKTELVINNKNGEVKVSHKDFFESWKNIFKKIDNALKIFNKHFDNPDIVNKSYLTIEGFTKKGINSIWNNKKV